MDIVQQIKGSIASVRDLSILSGIPEDRMYKWVSGASNPKAEDITALDTVFREISDFKKDEIKKLVQIKKVGTNEEFQQALRIATGNKAITVTDIKDGNNRKKKIDDKKDTGNRGKGLTSIPPTKSGNIMEQKLMERLENRDEQMNRLIAVIEKLSGIERPEQKQSKERPAQSA